MSEPVRPSDLPALIALSRRFGADPAFTRAGGGNSSLKADGVLWIKPSGVPLATLAEDDLVPLDRARLLEALDADPGTTLPLDGDPVMAAAARARLAKAHGRRPSVELLFHALLPERFVLHTHPIAVNAITCNSHGPAIAARLFGDRAVWVPYVDPGLPLARSIVEARRAHEARTGGSAPAITLLGNHGLIVGGETPDAIDAETAWLVGKIEAELAANPVEADEGGGSAADHEAVAAIEAALAPAVVVFDPHPLAARFAGTPGGRAFIAGGPLIPDQIVYTGSWPLVVDIDGVPVAELAALVQSRREAFAAQRGATPIVTVVPALGLFAAGATPAQADTARHIYLDMLRVAAGALRLGGIRHLSDAERTFIEHWEAEAYRQQVAAGR